MQSANAVACSLKSAKLTPPPSHVAPSGYGRPGRVRGRSSVIPAGASGGDQPDRGERRQGQHYRVRLAVPGGGLARHAARVAHVAAAIERGGGVEDLAAVAGAGG